jgi:hypothetical protein
MSAAASAASASATAGTTVGPVGVQAPTAPPLAFHPAAPLSTPLMKKLFELVGLKFAPAPSTPSAVYGGLIENAAVSYCPTAPAARRTVCQGGNNIYRCDHEASLAAAVQLAYPIAFATHLFSVHRVPAHLRSQVNAGLRGID